MIVVAARANLSRLQHSVGIGLAMVLGFSLNLLPVPLFFGLDFLVGGVFATVAGLVYGPVIGVAVAGVTYLPTVAHWNQPWALLILTLQTLWLSSGYRRIKGLLVELDLAYWVAVGGPLVIACYTLFLDLPVRDVAVVILKLTLNSLATTAAAGLLSAHLAGRVSRSRQPQSLSAYYSQVLLLTCTVPLVVLLIIMGRYTYRAAWNAEVNDARHHASTVAADVREWVSRYQTVVAQAAHQISAGLAEPGQMQVLLETAVMANPGLHNAYVANEQGTTVAFYPPVNAAGVSTIGLSFADRAYFTHVRDTRQPGVSDVFFGRGGIEGPLVVATHPLLTPQGDFAGYVLAALDATTSFNTGLLDHGVGSDHILVDGTGAVIAATGRFDPLETFAPDQLHSNARWIPVTAEVTHILPPGTSTLQQWERSELMVRTPIAGTDWTLYSLHSVASLKETMFPRYAWLLGAVLMIVTVAGPVLRMVSGALFRPISQLAAARLDTPDPVQNSLVVHLENSPISEVRSLVTKFRRGAARLARIAYYDPLTGLPNRAALNQRIRSLLGGDSEQRREAILLYLDLDGFKVVNDSLGHDVGDQLLKRVSHRLRGAVPPGSMVARLGGDEFTVVLEAPLDLGDAVRVAEQILTSLYEPFAVSRGQVVVTTSIGIVHSDRVQDANELLRCADVAMYEAKRGGKSRYAVYDDAMSQRALRRFEVEMELRRALDQEQFRLVYQPVLYLDNDRVACMEALIRWDHPVHGTVSPVEFIPLAEETGLIVPIDRWVLAEACRQVREWQTASPDSPPVRVAVNLSAHQFHSPTLVSDVSQALARTGVAPDLLIIEITESAVMKDAEAAARTLHELKTLGVNVAVDDFGTGYSSLSYLKHFPLNTLKIDQTFIQDVAHSAEAQAIVAALVTLARALALEVVAEGIETQEQLTALRALGVGGGQGFFLARPRNPGEAWAGLPR